VSTHFDVVIVGAGMVGATLACALANSRLKIAVLDSRAPVATTTDDFDLRVSAITLASRTLFENLGAWDAMQRRRVAPVEAMQVWEGQGEIQFDAAEIGEPCLAYIIENSVIQQSLVERLHRFTNIHALWPVEIGSIAFDQAHATVTLKDGRCLTSQLVVGADGAESAVRRAAGIDSRNIDMGQQGIVATVRTEKSHANIARQHFLPTGPLAFLPLPQPNACSIVWSADNARAAALLALDDAGFMAELQLAFGDRLGRLLSVSRRQGFALALAHANSYTAPRLALIGDAAHTVHPLAGQGVNLGLLDAAVLAETLLAAAGRARDLGAHLLLRRYERARKGGNLAMIAATGGFRYLFGNDWMLARGLRGAGLGLANAVAPIKRALMRRASGVAGELPALARRVPAAKLSSAK
jgi:2-polyprenylphenol 6-hydroxylase